MESSSSDDMMPGYRFYPTEEELVSFYLQKKILQGKREQELINQVIPELYIYEFNPWDLPQFAGGRCPKDPEQWFFFVPREGKEIRGGRPNRLTITGFWKATGSPGYVYSSDNRIIGERRTMVFYKGRAPTGIKTEWKMNEYKAIDGESASSSHTAVPKLREEFSLCRVYIKSKCLRTFDRRPSSSTAAAATMTSTAMAGDHNLATTTYHDQHQYDHQTMERMIITSPDSSSSGDHANPNSQTFNQAHDHYLVDHDNWAATTYHGHLQNDHPMMDRLITTSPNQSSLQHYANPSSHTFNQAQDHHHVDHDWTTTTYNDHHPNDHPIMERITTTSIDQGSSWDHANPNAQTLTSAHDNPNFDMGVDNSEERWDIWEQFNLF